MVMRLGAAAVGIFCPFRYIDRLQKEKALAAGMDEVPKAIVLTETAATEPMIATARANARAQQGCLLAQPVPHRTRLSKHTCGGQALGVAAASWGLPLHDFGEVPGADRHRVWHCGLVLGNGVTFHLYAVYLFTGARANTAARDKTNVTLQAILADAALLGQQPFLIIGDWNLEPIDSVVGPQIMDGSLVDVAVAAAGVHGRTVDYTFFASGSEGTRIDACVASPLAARAIKECYVDLACLDVAPHRPLRLCISGAICCEPQRTLKSHLVFTPAMLDSLEKDVTLHSTIDRHFHSHHAELQAALLDQDIDQLWSLISATLEQALLEAASSHVSQRSTSRRHVRGHFAWQQTQSCAPSASRGRNGDPEVACGAATSSCRRLLKHARQIQEVVRLRRLGRELAACDLWLRCTQLHSLHGNSIPDVLVLENIHEISWQAYHEAQQQVWQRRREAFVAKLRASTNRGFKLLQDDGAGPLTILADAQGNLTGSVWKVDSLLQEAWLPIFQKDIGGGPTWQPFQQLVAPHLVSHPWHLEPISAQQVNSALNRLKRHSARGADGWEPNLFRMGAGSSFCTWLAHLFNLGELMGGTLAAGFHSRFDHSDSEGWFSSSSASTTNHSTTCGSPSLGIHPGSGSHGLASFLVG